MEINGLRLRAWEGEVYAMWKAFSSPIPESHLMRQMVMEFVEESSVMKVRFHGNLIGTRSGEGRWKSSS